MTETEDGDGGGVGWGESMVPVGRGHLAAPLLPPRGGGVGGGGVVGS